MTEILNIISVVCLIVGLLFFMGTAVGLLRFPDFFTRMHAASKGDTLSSLLLIVSLAVNELHDPTWDHVLTSLKLLFIVLFICITSPTAGHALTEAAFASGARPWLKEGTSHDLLDGEEELKV